MKEPETLSEKQCNEIKEGTSFEFQKTTYYSYYKSPRDFDKLVDRAKGYFEENGIEAELLSANEDPVIQMVIATINNQDILDKESIKSFIAFQRIGERPPFLTKTDWADLEERVKLLASYLVAKAENDAFDILAYAEYRGKYGFTLDQQIDRYFLEVLSPYYELIKASPLLINSIRDLFPQNERSPILEWVNQFAREILKRIDTAMQSPHALEDMNWWINNLGEHTLIYFPVSNYYKDKRQPESLVKGLVDQLLDQQMKDYYAILETVSTEKWVQRDLRRRTEKAIKQGEIVLFDTYAELINKEMPDGINGAKPLAWDVIYHFSKKRADVLFLDFLDSREHVAGDKRLSTLNLAQIATLGAFLHGAGLFKSTPEALHFLADHFKYTHKQSRKPRNLSYDSLRKCVDETVLNKLIADFRKI